MTRIDRILLAVSCVAFAVAAAVGHYAGAWPLTVIAGALCIVTLIVVARRVV